jgi:transcriptional antiterminator
MLARCCKIKRIMLLSGVGQGRGITATELAKVFGVSSNTIRRTIHQYGLFVGIRYYEEERRGTIAKLYYPIDSEVIQYEIPI